MMSELVQQLLQIQKLLNDLGHFSDSDAVSEAAIKLGTYERQQQLQEIKDTLRSARESNQRVLDILSSGMMKLPETGILPASERPVNKQDGKP